MQPSFRSVDPVIDRDTLLLFARDLFTTSFRDPDWFGRRFGADGAGYFDWLANVTGSKEEFASLVLVDDAPAGLVLLGPEIGIPDTGHVYHYYLRPAARGLGMGPALNHYALSILRRHGFTAARLHVAPANAAAIRFYVRIGWRKAEDLPDKGVIAMVTSIV